MKADSKYTLFAGRGLFIGIAVLALIYYWSAKFGLSLAFTTKQVTLVWPPTGIALAAMLLFGRRLWPGIFIGAFVANFLTDETILVAFGIALGNTLEAFLGAYMLQRFIGFDNSMSRVKDVLGLFFFSGFASTAVSATIGTASLALGGIVEFSNYFSVWSVWWFGDMMGALVVAPLILSFANMNYKINQSRVFEGIVLLVFNLSLVAGLFMGYLRELVSEPFLQYFIFVPIIWGALRFGQLGAVITSFMTIVIALFGTLSGFGPFASTENVEANIVLLQTFAFVAMLASYLMGAVVSELNAGTLILRREKNEMQLLMKRLELSKTQLEDRVSREEAILANIGEGVVVINERGAVDFANDRVLTMLGRTREEVAQKDWRDLLALKFEDKRAVPEERHPVRQAIDFRERIATTPVITQSMRYFFFRKDGGKLPVQFTVSPVPMGGGYGAVAVVRDVSKELDLERAKTDFVSIASHQLRTPLSAVSWYAEMILAGDAGAISQKQKDYLSEIYRGNQRMVDLVNALLNVSRLEAGAFIVEPQKMNIKDVFKEVLAELKPQVIGNNLKVEENYAADLPQIVADYNLVRIIMQNLLSNAVKYTRKLISISVSLQRGVAVDEKDASDKEGVLIKISDDGIGIPTSQKQDIFTKLFRADNARQVDPVGTGLGLYIAKSIVDQTGGKIWFDSERNAGATFYVLFPIEWMEKKAGTRKLL